MATVSFDNATRVYPGADTPSVDALNLDIADGEFLVPNVSDNGRNGSHLYRANFGSRFSSPQPRKPICPVQAIVAVDDKIVHPSLINEMRRWSDDYTQTYVDGGHWAALGNPEGVAEAIASFAKKV